MSKAKEILKINEANENFKVGDVLLIEKEDKYVVVVSIGRHGGYYVVSCDPNGEIDRKAYLAHSNMYLGDKKEKVGTVRLKQEKFKNYTWTITGNKMLDMQKLPNLDDRMQLFMDFATEPMKKKYDQQEDRNYHAENAEMVSAFAAHMQAGNAPEDFMKAIFRH